MNVTYAYGEDKSGYDVSPRTILLPEQYGDQGEGGGTRIVLSSNNAFGPSTSVAPSRQYRDVIRRSDTPPDDTNTTDDPTNLEPAAELSREELVAEIVGYLQRSVLERTYGDLLSGSRSLRYEPVWPLDFSRPEPGPIGLVDRWHADVTFRQLYEPMEEWFLKPRGVGSDEVRGRQQELGRALIEQRQLHERRRKSPEKHHGTFTLYRNLPDATLEASVWAQVNLTSLALRREDWQLADERITAALESAHKLDYEPIVAKCWYWKGVVAHGVGDRAAAANCFLRAMPCVKVYQEGELLASWIDDYKSDMLDILDKQDTSQGHNPWSLQCRRAILGIDPWFRKFRYFRGVSTPSPPLSSPRESLPSAPMSWVADESLWPGHTHDEWMDLRGRANLDKDDQRSLYPRGVDWSLLNLVEAAGEKSDPVSEEKINQLLQGFSPAFERNIKYDKFVDGFDNYPDLKGSIAWNVMRHGQLLRDNAEPAPRPLVVVNKWDSSSDSSSSTDEQVSSSETKHAKPLNRAIGHPRSATNLFRHIICRPDITAEEKIAAYQEVLSHQEDVHDAEKTSDRRRPESNEEWHQDHQRARDDEARLKRFKAELINWNYERKHRAWKTLPTYRRKNIPRPPRPDSVIEWLEAETDKSIRLKLDSAQTPSRIGVTREVGADKNFRHHGAPEPSAPRLITPRGRSGNRDDTIGDQDHFCSSSTSSSGHSSRAYSRISNYDLLRVGAAVDAISNTLQAARISGSNVSVDELASIGDEASKQFERRAVNAMSGGVGVSSVAGVNIPHTDTNVAAAAIKRTPARRHLLDFSSDEEDEDVDLQRNYQLFSGSARYSHPRNQFSLDFGEDSVPRHRPLEGQTLEDELSALHSDSSSAQSVIFPPASSAESCG